MPLPPRCLPEQQVQDAVEQARIEAAIDIFNAHYERHGLIGEEFLLP